MRYKSKKKYVYIITFELFIILFIILCINIFKHTPPIAPSVTYTRNPTVEKTTWRKYIQEVGAKKAYIDFVAVYKQASSYIDQHASIHTIGELLYETEGLHGIAICDDSFSYGCFHGFFGESIRSSGLSKINQMDDACIRYGGINRSVCSHGIGHGILVYLGSKKLKEALDICDTLRIKLHAKGCKNGVFMEYNFNNLGSHYGKLEIRALTSTNQFSPCTELPKKHQFACYFVQPEWWEKVYNSDYKLVANLCDRLTGLNKEQCYLGLGNNALRTSNFDIEKTIMKCNSIQTPTGKMLCNVGASIRYKIQAEEGNIKKGNVTQLCNSLTSPLQEICVDKSQIKPKELPKNSNDYIN